VDGTGNSVDHSEVLDCVDAFAALRRIMRPECIEDIYNPLDGESREGIDGVVDLPGCETHPWNDHLEKGLESGLFCEEGEPLGVDGVYVGAE